MRTLPLLLVAGLLGTACNAVVDDDLAIDESTPELGTEPTAEPELDGEAVPTSIARLSTEDLTDACTIATDGAPVGDVRLAFPEGWIVGECGMFDPHEVVLDDDGVPEDVDIQWYVDPTWFPTVTEVDEVEHDRMTTTVSGLPAMRVEGHFPDDHASAPGMAFTTWYVDLSAGQRDAASILVGTVVEGVEVDYDGSARVLDLMARSLTAQNPYEDVPEDTYAIALRTDIEGAQATVTFDEGDCLTLRVGGVAGEVVSQACDVVLPDDHAVTSVALPWDEDTWVVAGFAHPDVDHVRATVAVDGGDETTVGAFPVANDNGPDVFAFGPLHEDDLDGLEAVDDGDVVITEFEAVVVERED